MPMTADSLTVIGSLSAGTFVIPDGAATNSTLAAGANVTRSKLVQEAVAYPIDLTTMRVWDAVTTLLPATGSTDDLGLVTGTFGTHIPYLSTDDFGANGAATPYYARFFFTLPPEYDTAETILLRCSAEVLTTVASEALTLDVETYLSGRTGLDDGGDLCATEAQSINSLDVANYDYTITAATLSSGDLLDTRLTISADDDDNLGEMIAVIYQVEFLLDIKG